MPLTVLPMVDSVLYLGDTKLTAAAAYLAGVMCAYNIDFDYLPSDEKFVPSLLSGDCRAVILSDYPAQNFSAEQLDALVEKAADGMGLLMIGGWESFTGFGGDYNDTTLSEVLPVVMQDRPNALTNPNSSVLLLPHRLSPRSQRSQYPYKSPASSQDIPSGSTPPLP